jgi:hypothetical protein
MVSLGQLDPVFGTMPGMTRHLSIGAGLEWTKQSLGLYVAPTLTAFPSVSFLTRTSFDTTSEHILRDLEKCGNGDDKKLKKTYI